MKYQTKVFLQALTQATRLHLLLISLASFYDRENKEVLMKLKYYFPLLLTFIISSNVMAAAPILPIDPLTLIDNAFASVANTVPVATCNAQGLPTSAVGSSTYASDSLYCALSVNSGVQTSMRGKYFSAAGIFCALNKVITFANDPTPTIHNGVMLSEADSCFGASGLDVNKDGDIADTFLVSLREMSLTANPGATTYDRLTEMQVGAATYNPALPNDIQLYLKDSNNLLAAKAYQTTSVTEAVVDKTASRVVFENRDYASFSHTRLDLTGILDPITGNVSLISNLKFIQALGNTGSENNSVLYSTDGLNTWANHFIGTAQSAGYPQCTGTCTSILIPYDPQFHNFTANPQTKYKNVNVMNITGPFNMAF